MILKTRMRTAHRRARALAAKRLARLLRLLCRASQHARSGDLPTGSGEALITKACAAAAKKAIVANEAWETDT